MRSEALGVKPGFQRAMQHHAGLAAGGFGNFAQPPGHGHAHAQANGFAESFFGRKAGGEVTHTAFRPALAAQAPGGQLGFAQNFGGKPLAMAL